MDERLRELQRQATADPEARGRLLREMVRSRTVDIQLLSELAALCGKRDLAAQIAGLDEVVTCPSCQSSFLFQENLGERFEDEEEEEEEDNDDDDE